MKRGVAYLLQTLVLISRHQIYLQPVSQQDVYQGPSSVRREFPTLFQTLLCPVSSILLRKHPFPHRFCTVQIKNTINHRLKVSCFVCLRCRIAISFLMSNFPGQNMYFIDSPKIHLAVFILHSEIILSLIHSPLQRVCLRNPYLFPLHLIKRILWFLRRHL